MDWLVANQADDGSWEDDVDQTAAVVEALNAGGRRGTTAQSKALSFIRSRQQRDGGFGEHDRGGTVQRGLDLLGRPGTGGRGDRRSDVASARVGEDPTGLPRGDAAARRQRAPLGHLATPTGSGPRRTRRPPSRARRCRSRRCPARSPSPSPGRQPAPTHARGDDGSRRGAGGTANGGNGDVTAGGGGNGAPLFSRPQPGSRGQQAGGRRVTTAPPKVTGGGSGGVAGQTVTGKLIGPGTATGASRKSTARGGAGPAHRRGGGRLPAGAAGGHRRIAAPGLLGGVQLERGPWRRRKAA